MAPPSLKHLAVLFGLCSLTAVSAASSVTGNGNTSLSLRHLQPLGTAVSDASVSGNKSLRFRRLQPWGSPATVTVRGIRGGSFTFLTPYASKLCSALVAEDLPHLSHSQLVDARSVITTTLGLGTLCIPVFGVLVVMDIPDHGNFVASKWIQLFANTVSRILDQNMDGTPDDPTLMAKMRSCAFRSSAGDCKGTWIYGRADGITDAQEEEVGWHLGMSVAVFQKYDFSTHSCAGSMRAMTEEIVHTWQHGLSWAYPAVFGAEPTGCPNNQTRGMADRIADTRRLTGKPVKCEYPSLTPSRVSQTGCQWESTMMKCGYKHAFCNWYTSQMCCSPVGATGTGDSMYGGDCLTPYCAGLEWYYNLLMEWTETDYGTGYSGAGYQWNMGTAVKGGAPFPESRAEVEAKLTAEGSDCAALLQVMKNPIYHQLSRKFDWSYSP